MKIRAQIEKKQIRELKIGDVFNRSTGVFDPLMLIETDPNESNEQRYVELNTGKVGPITFAEVVEVLDATLLIRTSGL